MLRHFSILILSAMTLVGPARAEVLLEPYAGLEMRKIRFNPVVGLAASDWEATGAAFGARLAYTMPMLFVGIDYSLDMASAKRNSPGSGDSDLTGSAFYALMGMQFSNLRAFAGYGVSESATLKNVPGAGDVEASAGGIKFGVGYSALSFVTANFEYRRTFFETVKTSRGELSVDGSGDTFLLSVSFPWEPFGPPSDMGGGGAAPSDSQ